MTVSFQVVNFKPISHHALSLKERIDWALERIAVTSDLNSFFKNGIGVWKSNAKIISSLKVVGNFFALPLGMSGVYFGAKKINEAFQKNDRFGIGVSSMDTLYSSSLVTLGSVGLAVNFGHTLSKLQGAIALNVAGFILSTALAIGSALKLGNAIYFRKKINENPGRALDFLQSQDEASLQRAFGEKGRDLIRFQKLDEALDENLKIIASNVVKIAIAILGIVGGILALTVTGPAAPILGGLAALLWLLVDSSWIEGKLHAATVALRNFFYPKISDSVEDGA